MSDKSEKILVWGEAAAILIVLLLVFAPHASFTENHLLHLFSEKLFDILLALFGTLLGYWLAKRHIEHLMAGIVKTLDTKYLNLFRERAFHRAVSEMLPELPNPLALLGRSGHARSVSQGVHIPSRPVLTPFVRLTLLFSRL